MNEERDSGVPRSRHLLSIVIPLFREGVHFRESFKRIVSCTRETGIPCEFILVDDGSDDDTWQVISAICREDPTVKGLRFSRNFGKEAAIYAGLEHTRGNAVIVMDGDLQHSPEMIPGMVHAWIEDGFQVVNVVRSGRGRRSFGYRMAAWMHGSILKMLSGFDLQGASDFKLLDRAVVEAFLEMKEKRIFYRGLIAWLGFRQKNLEMPELEGMKPGSSWNSRGLIRLALNSLTSFSTLALHLVTVLGLVLLLFSLGLAVHTLLFWLRGTAVPGFTTVILLQLFFSSIIMIALGIIGEYLATIFHEIKDRPRYILVQEFSEVDSSQDGE